MSDLIRRQDAELILAREMYATSLEGGCDPVSPVDFLPEAKAWMNDAPTIRGWIPCSERLPKVGRVVLLSTTDGAVVIGHREKPDLIWQVTEEDGRKHWVYDPESYEVDIDELPKSEDCGFIEEGDYSDGMLSVTSVNYDDRFGGVIAWMPIPEPYEAS